MDASASARNLVAKELCGRRCGILEKKMEDHFVIKTGFIERHAMTEKDFLELLGVRLKEAKPGSYGCPNCKRYQEDADFVYYKYKKTNLDEPIKGYYKETGQGNIEYCEDFVERSGLVYYLCICGCLYYYGYNRGPTMRGFGEKIE